MTQNEALEILKSGQSVLLLGEPGSGKTYTINKFVEHLKEDSSYPDITASTGLAATHINGMTIHSWLGIGIKKDLSDDDINEILEKPWISKKIESAEILIIDEISMLDSIMIDNIDRILSIGRNTIWDGIPFGGLQMVFVGDFFQLPPVPDRGRPKPLFAFESESWKKLNPTICYLTEQHRQEDDEFLEILKAMRNGTLEEKHLKRLKACDRKVPTDHITKLFTKNVDVDYINGEQLEKLEGEEHVYQMTEEGNPYIVKALKKNCLSPERLVLKEGALVMFTRNKYNEDENIYVNGTLGEVVGFDGKYPVVRTNSGDQIVVREEEWSVKERKTILAKINQIPLKLAWAMTVHKSQGLSLDAAIIDLSDAFEYGQGYVALSRVRSLEGLYLSGFNKHALKMHPKITAKDKEFRA